MAAPLTPDKALSRLAALCARAEQCEADLRRKLANWGITGQSARQILLYLKTNKFYDDARYARAFVRTKANTDGWGRIKIRSALAARQIAPDDIAEALKEIDNRQYSALLLKAARAKAARLDLALPADRQRLANHLLSRGYTGTETSQVINFLTRC